MKQLEGWSVPETVEFYSNNRHEFSELYDSEKHFITKAFFSDLDSVLDVGCAAGGFFNIFKSLNSEIHYTGLDVSLNLIEAARRRYGHSKSPEFIHYDGVSGFPVTAAYDLVFCSGALHLIDNWKEIFTNMVDRADKYVLADFRVTESESYVGNFIFDFADKREHSNFSTKYYVININELLAFFKQHEKISKIEIYGYERTPSGMAVGVKEVWMVFIKFHIDHQFSNSSIEIIDCPDKLRKQIEL
jgi:SAM-dependent methyltransferase